MSAKFLSFDLGAESGRAVLGTLENDRIQLTEIGRFLNTPQEINGHWHWNTKLFFQEMVSALKKTANEHPDLLSVACDTWGVDFVHLGPKDELIEEPYCYRDSRTDGMMEKAFARVSRREIYSETGIQFMALNTYYQWLAVTLGEGPSWNKTKTCLLMADYFSFLFSGKKAAEISLASTTQAWNPKTRQWSAALLEKIGVPTQAMAPLVEPGTPLGPLLPEIAAACGVSPKIQVIASCAHDTASAVAAVPAEGERWAYLSCGTWSLLGAELAAPVISEQTETLGFTNEAGLDGTIRFLKNIVGLWIVQECRRHWEQEGKPYAYSTLTQMAVDGAPFASLISSEDSRFYKPGRMPEKIAEFCRETKQAIPTMPGAFVRCALESLALGYRKTLEELESALGYTIDRLHIVGGGCQNQLLCQFTANAIGRPVIAGPVEATALGNCLVQARALGHVRDLSHLRQIVRNSVSPKEYLPQQEEVWKKEYSRFRALPRN